MLKIYLLAFLIVSSQHFCSAQEEGLMPGRYNDFAGKLGDMDISISIYAFENGELKGNYCTAKDDNRIQLAGKFIDNKIVLTEFINGKPSGYLECKLFIDSLMRLEGTWMNISKTKKIPFNLKPTSGISATFGYRYGKNGSEEGVEGFMKHVKSSIISKDKQWIANHTKYPLKVSLNGINPMEIKSKDQLMANFDGIFYPEYIDKLKSLCACNLFFEWQRIMLSYGEVYIEGNTLALDGFWIVTLNNSRK